jgi:phosphoserine aminotransferase
VFEWLKEQGGVEAMGKLNEVKKRTLYDFIDASGSTATRSTRRPLVDERAVPPGRRPSGQAVPGRCRRARPAEPQGPPLGGRHARLHLQRRGHGTRQALVAYMAEFEKEHG